MFNIFKKQKKKEISDDLSENSRKNKPIKTEFEKSVALADLGNVVESAHVGVCYHFGIDQGDEEHPPGLTPNPQLAIKYLTSAAEKGYLKAQAELASIYFDKDFDTFDTSKGFEWFLIAAKRGDPFSQCIVGFSYKNGDLIQKDENKAYHWFLEAASNGDKEAMNELGQIYSEKATSLLGKNDASKEEIKTSWSNAELSFKWYKKAADLGCVNAMYFTGVYYFCGFGTDINKELSLDYLNNAIENGSEIAAEFITEHFEMEEQ